MKLFGFRPGATMQDMVLSTNGVTDPSAARAPVRLRTMRVIGLLLIAAGLLWLMVTRAPTLSRPDPSALPASAMLEPGMATNMTSPALRYGPDWQVSTQGADPAEPGAPWQEPAGVLTFTYRGRVLELALAEGDYWGYLYVTIDGEPANQLAIIRGNVNSQGERAGYKTLLAPELATTGAPVVRWHPVHRAADDGPHEVRIEVWRSWDQTPLRALAVDMQPGATLPAWPGAALLGVGAWLLALGWAGAAAGWRAPAAMRVAWTRRTHGMSPQKIIWLAGIGVAIIVLGLIFAIWWLTLAGLALLGLAGLLRPSVWLAALLFGLPFYFGVKLPLLPNRTFELIDIGIVGGVLLLLFALLMRDPDERPNSRYGYRTWTFGLLMALATWALIAAIAADYQSLALREWRTVFLAAALFGVTLIGVLRYSTTPARDRNLLISAWLAGATLMAAIACWQFVSDSMLITAEGVRRVRGLYGSPNNLALYLERTLAVTLALALFGQHESNQRRGLTTLVWASAALIQGGALLLTFSKGAIFLALPTMLLTLWIGGYWLLGAWGVGRRVLWWLAGAGVLAGLLLMPFLGTERFQRLLDFEGGTGFLRLQLWRSAAQMALDHPATGVGPDNFLYAFRNRYLLPPAWQEPNLNHPHNWLLDWWTRLGVPGLILGIGFWFSGLRTLVRNLTSSATTRYEQTLALGLLAASLAALMHGLIDVSYALPDLMIVWVLIFFILPVTRGKV